MNNLFKITKFIFLFVLLNGCSQVLENVNLVIDTKETGDQESFNVVSKILTLEEANSQSKTAYVRKVLLNGRGSNAQIILEETALVSNFPRQTSPLDYKIGKGDILEFSKLTDNKNTNINFKTEWPKETKNVEYRLGIGDELALLQIVEENISGQNTNETPQISFNQEKKVQKVMESKGRIGSDGSALLLEVGKLDAINKTLNELRSEVRNILIRNGASPRFQLEIVNFRSQRAYLTINSISEVISLNDQPTDLRDILSASGQGLQPGSITRVKLQRSGQAYNMRLRDVFGPNAPKITILSGDHIFVEDMVSLKSTTLSEVGQNGFTVIEGVGKIKAAGRTLNELNDQVDGMIEKLPGSTNAFQLNIAEYISQKAFINIKDNEGQIIQISNKNTTLAEVLAQSGLSVSGDFITAIKLNRNNKVYNFTLDSITKNQENEIYLEPNDRISVEKLPYKENKVFILGGVTPQIFKINPSKRETLADILFTPGGPLSSSSAKRSEVYLLRGNNPVVAYHLDTQSPTRLIVADNMELRPNDILYVAEKPIISFNRTLATIVPLRLLLRDIQDENIP